MADLEPLIGELQSAAYVVLNLYAMQSNHTRHTENNQTANQASQTCWSIPVHSTCKHTGTQESALTYTDREKRQLTKKISRFVFFMHQINFPHLKKIYSCTLKMPPFLRAKYYYDFSAMQWHVTVVWCYREGKTISTAPMDVGFYNLFKTRELFLCLIFRLPLSCTQRWYRMDLLVVWDRVLNTKPNWQFSLLHDHSTNKAIKNISRDHVGFFILN